MTAHWTNAIGYCAASLTTVAFVPQVARVVKLRSARDVSLGMFLIFSAGTFLWLCYGVLQHALPIVFANGVTFLLSVTMLVLKLRYDRHATEASEAPR